MGFTSSYITVKTTFVGIHQWSGCPFTEVSFLTHPHRHIFHVDVVLPVSHDDRDLEFFIVKACLDDIIALHFERNQYTNIVYLGERSCEMIAKEIIEEFLKEHDVVWMRCSVSEDNENGAGVMWEKHEGPLI
jgi:hypothetical protein